MKIFYTEIEKFKKDDKRAFLVQYDDIGLKNEKRFYEYTIGRYLVKSVAKRIYNLNNTDIIADENGKPVFKCGGLHFNISHSKNIVIVCFDGAPCGIDIEFIKERDLEKLAKYYKRDFKNLEEFYGFWTMKEAVYKLGCESKYSYSSLFREKYFIAVVSSDKTKIEAIEAFV